MRWAFWRERSDEPQAPAPALPHDVGLPGPQRPPAAPRPQERDDLDGSPSGPATRTSGAVPSGDPVGGPVPDVPLTAPQAACLDRSDLAAAGPALVRAVEAVGTPAPVLDARVLAVAATGALAARLPALSGVDGAGTFDEPEDELLHAYAELLAGRAQARAADVDRDDLLAVAHVAAAAVSVGAADEPALLLLAGVPADVQLRAAALLLAQTADDGGGAPARLPDEVRELFAPPG